MIKLAMVAAVAMLSAAGFAAAPRGPASAALPVQIERLVACRRIGETAARLACFDREVAAVQTQIAAKDLMVVDRAQAKVARRSLFGFASDGISSLFGGGGDDEVKQIDGVIAEAHRNSEGGWTVRLKDGSSWTQTEGVEIVLRPVPGQKVVVRRAALGSFKLSVNGQPAVRVKRIG